MMLQLRNSTTAMIAGLTTIACATIAESAVPRITAATIAAVNSNERTITATTSKNERLSLKVSASAKIEVDRVAVALDALKSGQRVTITFDSATNVVSRITARTRSTSPRRIRPKPRPAPTGKDSSVRPSKDSAKRTSRKSYRLEKSGSDWPQWRGPNQDGISTETGLLAPWPAQGLREIWSTQVGEGYSGMVVADGRIVTMDMQGSRENIRCFDAATGDEVWSHGYAGAYRNSFGSGPRATPTIEDGRVYALGANGHLHCLNAESGAVVWERNLLSEFGARNIQWGISGSPFIMGGYVFVNPGGSGGRSLAAIEKSSGKTVWTSQDDQAGYATPIGIEIGGTQAVVFFTAAGIVGVEPQRGRELFRFRWSTQYDCNIATPIFHDNKLFISSNYGAGCALLELTAEGRGIGVRQVYTNKVMKNHFSTCVLMDGCLYGFSDAVLTCMDFATGSPHWRQRGLGKGSLTYADGHLIILSESGELVLARATPDRFELASRFQALSGKCWTVPVVAGGRLFVRNEQNLKCFKLRDRELQ